MDFIQLQDSRFLVHDMQIPTDSEWVIYGIPDGVKPLTTNQGTRWLCSKFYLLCYAALLKNFAYYAQIMLIDIEQFSDIYSSIPLFCR